MRALTLSPTLSQSSSEINGWAHPRSQIRRSAELPSSELLMNAPTVLSTQSLGKSTCSSLTNLMCRGRSLPVGLPGSAWFSAPTRRLNTPSTYSRSPLLNHFAKTLLYNSLSGWLWTIFIMRTTSVHAWRNLIICSGAPGRLRLNFARLGLIRFSLDRLSQHFISYWSSGRDLTGCGRRVRGWV